MACHQWQCAYGNTTHVTIIQKCVDRVFSLSPPTAMRMSRWDTRVNWTRPFFPPPQIKMVRPFEIKSVQCCTEPLQMILMKSSKGLPLDVLTLVEGDCIVSRERWWFKAIVTYRVYNKLQSFAEKNPFDFIRIICNLALHSAGHSPFYIINSCSK